jgi:hypothetical protein
VFNPRIEYDHVSYEGPDTEHSKRVGNLLVDIQPWLLELHVCLINDAQVLEVTPVLVVFITSRIITLIS